VEDAEAEETALRHFAPDVNATPEHRSSAPRWRSIPASLPKEGSPGKSVPAPFAD